LWFSVVIESAKVKMKRVKRVKKVKKVKKKSADVASGPRRLPPFAI